MKFKKFLLVICLFICLLTMASVCAGDVDNTLIQSGNGTQDDVIALDEVDSQDMISSSDENLCGASFADLQTKINNAKDGDEIVLNDDYSLDSSEHTLKISKSITLKSEGLRTFYGNSVGRLIDIDADGKSITFENIVFKNGKVSDNGGAILNTHSQTSLTFINCKFEDNNVGYYGGAVYSDGELNFNHCEFYKNFAGVDGGAIYGTGKTNVTLSDFKKK